MIDRRTTYIDPTFTPFGSHTKIVKGVTFRSYNTGNSQYAMISDDGNVMVKQGYLNVTYTAYVLGHGPILGGNVKPKPFRNQIRACEDAVALLKLIRAAQ